MYSEFRLDVELDKNRKITDVSFKYVLKIIPPTDLAQSFYERVVLVPVEEIHHKKPLSEGGTHDRSNLIALCKSCHSQIHAKRGDRWHDR